MTARRTWWTWLLGPLVVALAVALATPGAGAEPVAGGQGIDTSLPLTDSALMMRGRGQFADLAITVNQTAKLTNQAVSITWTGAEPTRPGPGRFGSRYMQIMQCWGDDDGTVPDNPGPPPEQCVQGAVAATYGGLPGGLYPSGLAVSRIISRSDWANYDNTVGYLDTRTTNVWRPFRSVGGTVVDIQTDPKFNPSVIGGNFWLNPYFNIVTTNEIAGGLTGPDGTGAELMQVLTGKQSSGLGCGQKVQPVTSDESKVPQCWLVVVPRGAPADENIGTPFEENADQAGVVTSPLSPAAWQHRIAFPLDFNPVDSPCSLASEERRIAGSEMALRAVASWQPSLCASGDLPPYSYSPVSDASARQQLTSTAAGAPGMVVVSRPLSSANANPDKPVLYAPISASGLVIAFNIERNPRLDAPEDEQRLAGVRVARMNLTPRLVAKLLTQSYRGQLEIYQAPDYEWLAGNPVQMGRDPDFLQFNPEFELLQTPDGRSFGGLQLPAGNSDAAQQVWEWVLADPEARAWMDGQPDEWGMRVNPIYATTAGANSTGVAFGDPLPNSFPKNDPYCYQAPARGAAGEIVPPKLCATDWMPYGRSLDDTAQIARSAYVGARIVDNPFAQASTEVWSRELPQFLGTRLMLALTDTPSAAKLGLQVAQLSRAGDNGPDRAFVAPGTNNLIVGVAAMAPKASPTVLEPAPTVAVAGAYPLTTLTYAAIAPLGLDEQARADYAAFIEYAAGPGQVPGFELGQLPPGYAPLSAFLRGQALEIANDVRTLVAKPAEPATTTTTTLPTAAAPPSTSFVPVPVQQTTSARPRSNTTATPTATRTATTTAPVTASQPTDTEAPSTTEAPTTTEAVIEETVAPTTTAAASITPFIGLARSRYAVPGLGVMALGSALGVLEITKRPRRRLAGDPDEVPVLDELEEN